jgi:uncharacterized protein YukE
MAMIRGNPQKMQELASLLFSSVKDSGSKMERLRGQISSLVSSGQWSDASGQEALAKMNAAMTAWTAYENAAVAIAKQVGEKANTYRGGR